MRLLSSVQYYSPATSHIRETPLRVEVTGPLLTFDGESSRCSTEEIPLEDGPRVVPAECFAPHTDGLAGKCPDDTAQASSDLGRGGQVRQRRAREDQRPGLGCRSEAMVNPLAS